MPVDQMLAADRKIDGARHQVEVDPCVDAQPRCMRRCQHRRERVEAGRLTL
jgi:hypothetical protein